MPIEVEKTGAACGAFVTGLDLTQDISADLAGELRAMKIRSLPSPTKISAMMIWSVLRWPLANLEKTRFSAILTVMKTLPPFSATPMKKRRYLLSFSIPIEEVPAGTCLFWHHHSARRRQYTICRPSGGL